MLASTSQLGLFYELDIVAEEGGTTADGAAITTIDREVSVNAFGEIALTADLNASGEAVLLATVSDLPRNLSYSVLSGLRDFIRPRITAGGSVVVVEEDLSTGNSSVQVWDVLIPGAPSTVVASGDPAPPFGAAAFDIVSTATIAVGSDVAFVGRVSGADGVYVDNVSPIGTPVLAQGAVTGDVRPMAGAGPRVVLFDGSDLVVLETTSTGWTSTRLASTTSGATVWTSLGGAPGISEDGTVVAFAGDRGNGEGIFLFVDQGAGFPTEPIVVAGEQSEDLGTNDAGVKIRFADFELDSRVGVARMGSGNVGAPADCANFDCFLDTYIVSYVAIPDSASISNPAVAGTPLLFTGEQGLWAQRVEVAKALQSADIVFHALSPRPVIQIGGPLAGSTVTGIDVYDPIAAAVNSAATTDSNVRRGDHYIAFRATTAAGDVAVVRARHFDTDADGLLDHWERAGGGIDIDQNGTVDLSLSALGANPRHKDMFLEIDWLADQAEHRHEPIAGATATLAAMFAAAPVQNPDGKSGITAHIDAGSRNDSLGDPFSQNMPRGAALGGGDRIGMPGQPNAPIDRVYFTDARVAEVAGVQARSLEDIKNNFFGTRDKRARELAFRYVVIADLHSYITDAADNPLQGSVTAAAAVAGAAPATLTVSGTPFTGHSLSGHMVKITSGTGAGQIKSILSHTNNTLTLWNEDWDAGSSPDATSQYAILSGSSGRGEIGFRAAPDEHAYPGNDVLVTLRGFGTNTASGAAFNVLGTQFDQWRTLAHELGHTLALRHCGTDSDSSVCESTPATYASLMSYAHQLEPTSAVNQYAVAGDPTFDDWRHLRLDFQYAFSHLGTSRASSYGDVPQPEATLDDYVRVSGELPDFVGPTAALHHADGDPVPKNRNLVVDVTATDDRDVLAVLVEFDLDGDGVVEPDEQVLGEGAAGEYRASLGNVTGPTGNRPLTTIVFDTSGNYAIDTVTVEVTHDLEILPGLVEQIGISLQKAIPDLPESAQIPFLRTQMAEVVDLATTFKTLANRLYDDSRIGAPGAPPSYVLAEDESFLVNVGGTRPVNVVIDHTRTTDNTTVDDLVDDVNHGLSLAGLAGMVVAVPDGNALALTLPNDGSAVSLSLTTLRLAGGGTPVAFGQLPRDLNIQLDIHRDTIVDNIVLDIPMDITIDNIDVGDLVLDLNDVLLEIGRTDLTAVVGPLGGISFAAVDPTITGLNVTELGPGDLDLLGFLPGQIGALVTELDFPALGLAGLRDVSDLRFDSLDAFGQLLQAELEQLSDWALPGSFDVGLHYDVASDTIQFNLALNKSYAASVELDLVDFGVDLGPLGTVELAAIADGSYQVDLSLNLQVTASLDGLGLDFQLTATSPLTDLNGSEGVQVLVGATAASPVSADGQIGSDLTFQIRLTHQDPADDSMRLVTLRYQPDPADPAAPSSSDNFNLASLASDLNLVLEENNLGDIVAFATDGSVLRLVASDAMPAGLSPLRSFTLTGAEALGFAPEQPSDYPDLVLTIGAPAGDGDTDCTDGGCTFSVVLDGTRTIQDVMDRIAAATGGAVAAALNHDKSGIDLSAGGDLSVEQAFVTTGTDGSGIYSQAGIGLGVLGVAVSGSVSGDVLHGQSLSDRLYITPSSPGSPGLSFTARVDADLDVSAALGKLAFDVRTTVPLSLAVGASAMLLDPNADDDRIYLSEILASPGAVVDIDLSSLVPTATGTLAAYAQGNDAWYSPGSQAGTTQLFQLSIQADAASGFQFTADADFQNLFSSFKDICVTQLLDMLHQLADQLADSSALPWLNVELPLVNRTLADILALAEVLRTELSCVPDPGGQAVIDAVAQVEAAIGNLSQTVEERTDLLRTGDLLRQVITPPEDPAELDEYVRRFPSRLISAVSQLGKVVHRDVPVGTAGHTELLEAVGSFADLFCTWETVEAKLEVALETAAAGLLGDQVDIDIQLGMVDDFDGVPATNDRAIVVGLTLSADVSAEFEPDLPISDSMGPLEFEVSPGMTLVAGVSASFGLGLTMAETPALFVVVDPPAGNPDLVKTGLNVTFGFDGAVDTGVSFGSFDLVDASGRLTLAAAVTDRDLVPSGNTVTLGATPLDEDERQVIVTVNGTRRPFEDFRITGQTLTFLQNAPTGSDAIDVTYRTAATPGEPLDLAANPSQRAGMDIDFAPATPIAANTVGAVALADLVGSVNAAVSGMVTGALDVALLGAEVANAVTLAVAMAEPLQPQFQVDEQALLSMFTNVDFDLKSILTAIETFLAVLEEGLAADIFGNVPVVGNGLDTSATFIGTLREQFVTPLREFLCFLEGTPDEIQAAIRDEIWNLLGPGGAGILGDRTGDGSVDIGDIDVVVTADSAELAFSIAGHDELVTSFDIGLGGLPVRADGQGGVQLDLNYTIDLGFGVGRTGPYLLTNEVSFPLRPAAEIDVGVEASLLVDRAGPDPLPTSLLVDLFGLQLSATDVLTPSDKSGTFVSGRLYLDVLDAAGDGRVYVTELASTPFPELVAADLGADIGVHLRLAAGLGTNLPQLQTELVAGWHAGLALRDGELAADMTNFDLGLENTGVNLGAFLSQHVGMVLSRITEQIEPIRGVIDLLLAKVPGVNEVSEAAKKGSVTFLDLALAKTPDVAATARKFVEALDAILDLTDSLETLGDDSSVFVLMDDVTLSDPASDANDDDWARGVDVADAVAAEGGQTGDTDTSTGTVRSILQQLEELGIHLYMLDVQNVMRMLLGQPFDVIAYELPEFRLPIEFEAKFPAWAIPPITIQLGLDAEFTADLSIGYDSHGLDVGNFFQGFYFGDRQDVFAGADIDEFGLSVGVSLAALLDVGLASAGVEGELRAEILANWRDLDSDGKVHLDEIESILATDGLECVFDLSGEFRAIVRLVWEVLGSEGGHDFIDALLFKFKNKCPKAEPAHVSDGGEELPGGPDSQSQAGTLIIHAGAFAHLRGPGTTTDTSEIFTLTELAPGVIQVEGMGLDSRYAGVTRIFFDGGNGADWLVASGVTLPVTALGGTGNDTLLGGSGNDYLDGGDGDDDLDGQAGSDELVGGAGNDVIFGGTEADTIFGDSGDDFIDGGDGADDIDAGSGNDEVHGGEGNDTIDGNAGDDVLYGGDNDDTILGHAGNDLIFGDDGNDEIYAGSGSDLVSGGFGADVIYGESGNDLLAGGLLTANSDLEELASEMFQLPAGFLAGLDPGFGVDSADELWGGLDNDLLVGDAGADTLMGGWGDDLVVAHLILDPGTTDAEYVEGGPGNDLICGSNGHDTIFGGTADLGLSHVLTQTGGATYGGFSAIACSTSITLVPPARGSIAGWKFLDADGDGAWDADEPVLAGWTIHLWDGDGNLVDSRVTGADGAYRFEDVEYGSYEVSEDEQRGAGYFQTYPGLSVDQSVYLDAGESIENINFGNTFLGASIRGRKFHDVDGNGVWSAGEPGLNGWQIQLFDTAGNLLGTALTADLDLDGSGTIDPATEAGWYAFAELAEGDFVVAEIGVPGWVQSAPPLASSDTFLPLVDDGYTATQSDIFVRNTTGLVDRVRVTVNVEHETLSHLDAWLIAPDGTRVDLFSNVGGNGNHFTNTVFDDIAAVDISDAAATAPFTGSYRPESSLSALGGISANGTWTLVIQDETRGVAGRLLDWQLTINTDAGAQHVLAGGSPSPLNADALHAYDVSLGIGDALDDLDFGNYQVAIVVGRKYAETSANLPADREPGVGGVVVFADLNDNGTLDWREPSTTTSYDKPQTTADDAGRYRLASLPVLVDRYAIREVVPPRAEQVYPQSPTGTPLGHFVQPRSGERLVDRDFGNRLTGEIHGTKWLDTNGNGRRDPGEPGQPGVVVYADLNDNGRLDAGEPSDTTMRDDPETGLDETGRYWLVGLDRGRYVIREVVPESLVQTSGGREVAYRTGFDQPASPALWSHTTTSLSPSGRQQYLGPFENQTVTLTLNNLPVHDELFVAFDLVVIGSWDGNHPTLGPDRWQLKVRDGVTLVDTTFSNTTNDFPTYHNPVDRRDVDSDGIILPRDVLILFNSLNAKGSRELKYGETWKGVDDETRGHHFYDVTGEGLLSPRDAIVIINRLNLEGPGPAEAFGGGDLYPQAYPGNYGAGSHAPRREAAEFNSLGFDRFEFPSGHAGYKQMSSVYRMHFRIPHATDSVTLDFTALGLQNFGEMNFEMWGLDNVLVGMPTDYHVVDLGLGEVVERIDFGNAPTGAVEGVKWEDFNANGRRDVGERGWAGVQVYADLNENGALDAGEPRAVTEDDDPQTPGDERGRFRIPYVPAGRRTIREIVPPGARQTYPRRDPFHQIDVVAGQSTGGADFGNQPLDLGWDFGDAPAIYPTLLADNGARHRFLTDVRLGTLLDTESDGIPSLNAHGDDQANLDDEDGVLLTSIIAPGQPIEFQVDVSIDGFLSAWFDWNNDGDWRDAGEAVAIGTPLKKGTNQVSWPAPSQVPTHVYARFRFATMGVGSFEGIAIDGEVEDYRFATNQSPPDGENPFNNAEGLKWADLDGDGIRDPGEPGMGGVVIYADLDGNQSLDPGEPFTVTRADNQATPDDEAGPYRLENLPFGTVSIREVIPPGTKQTFPPGGEHVVTFLDGETHKDLDFGNQPLTGRVHGRKWRDTNGNGLRDNDEPGMAGIVIYADVNGNGGRDTGEPATQTMPDDPQTPEDETGQYWLADVPVGRYSVREVVPDGFVPSHPLGGGHPVDVKPGDEIHGKNFGNAIPGSVHGRKWEDADGDSQVDQGEPGLAGVVIYADLNGNGKLDAGEPWTRTMQDDPQTPQDETGEYWLEGLPPGEYPIREIVPDGYEQTFPPGGAHVVVVPPGGQVLGRQFGNAPLGSIHGTKWYDVNGNWEPEDSEPRLAGVVIYADLNDNGTLDAGEPRTRTMDDDPGTAPDETGMYWLGGLPAGTYVVREVVPDGYEQTYPPAGSHLVELPAGMEVYYKNFANHPLGEVQGWKWSDNDGDATADTGEPGIAGVTIYADANGNRRLDNDERWTTTRSDDPATGVDETGTYRLVVPAGSYVIRELVPDGYVQTYPVTGHAVVVNPLSVHSGYDFGNQPTGDITGAKWNDTNANGQWDAGESGEPGVTIYIDANDNGALDGGELFAVTTDDDPNTTANESGQYALRGIPAGDVRVREIVPAGFIATYPVGGVHIVDVPPLAEAGNVDFGNHKSSGSIRGTKWSDETGALGVRDPADAGIAGVTIYLDTNGNERLDHGEPSTVTVADDPATTGVNELGNYAFDNLAPGTYAVREVIPAGSVQSYPLVPHSILLRPNQQAIAVDFGNYVPDILEDGDDVVYAGGGDDVVYGDNLVSDPRVLSEGTRRDTLYGEAGVDQLFGQERADRLNGGEDSDTLDGGEDLDTVFQTTDNDQLLTNTELTGQGTDTLVNNSIEYGELTGLGGNNRIDASAFTLGGVTLSGGDGHDVLVGTASKDLLIGGPGNDTLDARGDADTLDGGDGSDTLIGGEGDDRYPFEAAVETELDAIVEATGLGGGVDLLDYRLVPASQPVVIDLVAGTGSQGSRSFLFQNSSFVADPELIENIEGGAGADTLIGNSANNLLVGNAGDDTLVGNAGNDTLVGGPGSDQLDGGSDDDLYLLDDDWGLAETIADDSGFDTVDLGSVSADLTVTIGSLRITDGTNEVYHAGDGIERVVTGSGDDVVLFSSDTASLAGGTGTLDTGAGLDTLDYRAFTSAAAVNVDLAAGTATGLASVAGVENATGGDGDDTLTGDDGDNVLKGRAGNDIVTGGGGNDTLVGGLGDDTLRGGPGDDTYEFAAADPGEVDIVAELAGEGFDTLDHSRSATGVVVTLNSDTIMSAADGPREIQVEVTRQYEYFERVIGSPYDDHLTANGANNELAGGQGDDVYALPDGVTGVVTLVEPPDGDVDGVDFSSFTGDVVFDLRLEENVVPTRTSGSVTVRLVDEFGGPAPLNFENLRGGSANDTLTGNDGNNLLSGGKGDDKLLGGRGNDLLDGGSGINSLYGESGADRYRFSDVAAAATSRLVEEAGFYSGGFMAPGGSDTVDLERMTGNVTFDLSLHTNVVGLHTILLENTAGAAAPAYFENVLGSTTGRNDLTGNDAANILVGGPRADVLAGGAGNDILIGLAGADQLSAASGRNLLLGGLGADQLVGGTDEDVLVAGTTSYDAGFTSMAASPYPTLDALRIAWSSSKSYEDRIDELMAGLADPNEPGELARLVAGDTVLNDADADTLDGLAALDWFFALPDAVTPDPDGLVERIE